MPAELEGEWKGIIKTYENNHTVRMTFQKDGDVHVKITGQMETLLNDNRFNNNVLTGSFHGEIPTGDAERHPHRIGLFVKLRGNRLSGWVTAQAFRDGYAAYGISSWIELFKK